MKIQQDLELLKSFVIGTAGKDREGSYRPKAVKKILKALQDKSKHTFEGADSFLRQLQEAK